jgi:hypothetical protein
MKRHYGPGTPIPLLTAAVVTGHLNSKTTAGG